jgi:ABC-type bacteriocin/lantibiotic exporter with double-glycine peptidase domain
MIQLGQVESHQQETQYTCSAAALHAVLKHYGLDIDERSLSRLIEVSPKTGASAAQVIRTAKRLGFRAELRFFASLQELKKCTDRDVPVITNILSFRVPNQGHFVVVTDVDEKSIRMMDPNAPGNWRTISHAEMKQRWGFRDYSGVVVTPKTFAALGETDNNRSKRIAVIMVLAAGAAAAVFLNARAANKRLARRRKAPYPRPRRA